MKFFYLILSLIISSYLSAQELVYTNISSENGLSSSNVTQVIQDNKGLIWFSTNNGVTFYDAYQGKQFNTDDNLSDSHIVRMFKDDKGCLWFLGKSGTLSYYVDGVIKKYKYNNSITSVLNNYDVIEKTSISMHNNELEFNVYEKARYKIDSLGALTVIYDLSQNRNFIDLRSLQSRFFISHNNTELEIIEEDEHYLISPFNIHGTDPILFEKDGNSVYIANQNKLFSIINGKIDSIIFNNVVTSINIDHTKNLWVGFKSDGIYCYKNANLKRPYIFHELVGNSISSTLLDKNNSLWVSSTNNGIFFIPSLLFNKITTNEGLTDNNIQILDFSDKYLWAITGNQSVSRMNFLKLENFNFNNSDYTSLTDIFWYNKRLWLSFKNKLSYFKKDSLVDLIRLNDRAKTHSRLNDICYGRNNSLWLCKTDGFAQIKDDKVIFESTVNNFQNLNVNKIIEEPNGNLWLACKNGLWKFENNKLFNYNQNNNLLSENINDMTKDTVNGALWLCISGKGIVKIINDSIWHISEKDGLPSNYINSVFAQGNSIWFGSNRGLSRINATSSDFSNTIVNISRKDGLLSNEVKDVVVNDQFVFVATNKGIGYFDYTKFQPYTAHIHPKIEYIKAGGEVINSDSKKIKLDYYSNNIEIKYIAIHYKSQGNIFYRYRIKGLDKSWLYTTNLVANYPFIPPGNYTLEISASNEKNKWNNDCTRINIVVEKPFWLEWWFFVAIAFVLILLGYLLYKILINIRKKKEKTQQEINEYRQRALTRQMNPHFIFNSLNSIQHYILQNDIRLSSRFLSKFSKLIRITLENSKESFINLESEIDSLTLYLELEALRFKEKMVYNISVDPEIDLIMVKTPPMLIQPFVENAIWHGIMNKDDGEQGVIDIKFIKQEEAILCVIKDNGVGREKSNAINQQKNSTHNSLGTSITQDRIDLINNVNNSKIKINYVDLKEDTNQQTGTIVNITLQ